MAYLITKRTPEGRAGHEMIASLRVPDLVADLVQRLDPEVSRDEAWKVAEDLIETKRSGVGDDTFHALEI